MKLIQAESRLNALGEHLRLSMLKPGSIKSIDLLLWIRYTVHTLSLGQLVSIGFGWGKLAESHLPTMFGVLVISVLSTVLLHFLKYRAEKQELEYENQHIGYSTLEEENEEAEQEVDDSTLGAEDAPLDADFDEEYQQDDPPYVVILSKAALFVFLLDMTLISLGIALSGLSNSPIVVMPLLTAIIASLVLPTGYAVITFGGFVFSYLLMTILAVEGYLPQVMTGTTGGMPFDPEPYHMFGLQVFYHSLVLAPFFFVINRLRNIYREYDCDLRRATRRVAKEVTQRQKDQHLIEMGHMNSYLAHEIRNPLSVIRWAAEGTLYSQGVEDTIREAASDTVNQVDRLNRMLTSVLDYAGKIVASPKAFLLKPTIDSLLKGKTRVQVVDSERVSQSQMVWVDADHFEQVFLNLVKNAEQATPEGKGVFVRLHLQAPNLCVEIHDEGSGIPLKRRKEIFKPFFTTKKRSGTGLGLAITKRLCDSNGILLEVDDSPHGGACFRVHVPLSPRQMGQQKDHPNPSALAGKKLLLIDDEDAIHEHLKRVLKGYDIELFFASDIFSGQARFLKARPDFIILDLLLRSQRGTTFINWLEEQGSQVPVIILSAFLDEEEKKELFMRPSVRLCITKPASSHELIEALMRINDESPMDKLEGF